MDKDTYQFFEGCKEIKNNNVVTFFSEQLSLSNGKTQINSTKQNCVLVAITSPLPSDSYYLDFYLNDGIIMKQKLNFNKFSFLHAKIPFINYSPEISIHSRKERIINLVWAQLSDKYAERLKNNSIMSIDKNILFSDINKTYSSCFYM